ncbi:MAG: Ig-like domain-containing protein [Butyrivibrio sp.]|nr:Ig-like domain-containing protein [Butyrivibrio sp.]
MKRFCKRIIPGILAAAMLFSQLSLSSYASEISVLTEVSSNAASSENYLSEEELSEDEVISEDVNNENTNGDLNDQTSADSTGDNSSESSKESLEDSSGNNSDNDEDSTVDDASAEAGDSDSINEETDNNNADQDRSDTGNEESSEDSSSSTGSSSLDESGNSGSDNSSSNNESTDSEENSSDAATSGSLDNSDAASSYSSESSSSASSTGDSSADEEEVSLQSSLYDIEIDTNTLIVTPSNYTVYISFYSKGSQYSSSDNAYVVISTEPGTDEETDYTNGILLEHKYEKLDTTYSYQYHYYGFIKKLLPNTTYYYTIYREDDFTMEALTEESSFTTKDIVTESSITFDESSFTANTSYGHSYVSFKLNNPNNESVYSFAVYHKESGYKDYDLSKSLYYPDDEGVYTSDIFHILNDVTDYYFEITIPYGEKGEDFKKITYQYTAERKVFTEDNYDISIEPFSSSLYVAASASPIYIEDFNEKLYCHIFYKKTSDTEYTSGGYLLIKDESLYSMSVTGLSPDQEYDYILLISPYSGRKDYTEGNEESSSYIAYEKGTFTTESNVTYSAKDFPDDNFRALVMEAAGITKESQLTSENLEKVTRIVDSLSETDTDVVSDVTGAELLTNLETLWLSNHDVSALPDLSGLKNIRILRFSGNDFEQMPDLSNISTLTSIGFDHNYLEPDDDLLNKVPEAVRSMFENDLKYQNTKPSFAVADTYYETADGYPFIIEFNQVKNRTYTVNLKYSSKKITKTKVFSYSISPYYLTIPSLSGISGDCSKDISVTITDQTGRVFFSLEKTVNFVSPNAMAVDIYATSAYTSISPKLYVKTLEYDKSLVSNISLKKDGKTYSTYYTVPSTHSGYFLGDYGDVFKAGNYSKDLTSNQYLISPTIYLGEALEAGDYDVELTYDGTTNIYSGAVHINNDTVITGLKDLYSYYQYNTDDKYYTTLLGTNLIYAMDNGLNITLWSLDGSTQYGSLDQVIVQSGTYATVSFNRTAAFNTALANFTGSQFYCTYKISGEHIHDKTSSDKTLLIYERDTNYTTFEDYNYKLGYYEIFFSDRIDDKTTVKVSLYPDGSSDELLASATGTVSDHMLKLVFTSADDGSEFIPKSSTSYYFKYEFTFPDGTTKTTKKYATVTWYNYSSTTTSSDSSSSKKAIKGGYFTVTTGSKVSLEPYLKVPCESYSRYEDITVTINGISATLPLYSQDSTYYIYKGTWEGTFTNAATYPMVFSHDVTTLATYKVFAVDEDVFYQTSQSLSTSEDGALTVSFGSKGIEMQISDIYSTLTDTEAIEFFRDNYLFYIYDPYGNNITSNFQLSEVNFSSSSISFSIYGDIGNLNGIYIKVTDKKGRLGLYFNDSGNRSYYAYAQASSSTPVSEDLGAYYKLTTKTINVYRDSTVVNGYSYITFKNITAPITVKFYDPADLSVVDTISLECNGGNKYYFTKEDLQNIDSTKVYRAYFESADGTWIIKNGFYIPSGHTEEALTNLYFKTNEGTVSVGDTKRLTASIYPFSINYIDLSWSCSDESVVSILNNYYNYCTIRALKEGSATITVTSPNGLNASYEITITKAASGSSGITVEGIEDSYTYTGSAICPKVEIYYDDTLLTLNTDYSLKYANNTKAASSTDTKAPSVTISFKGNYKNSSGSKWVENFSIASKDIGDEDEVTIIPVTAIVKTNKKGNVSQSLVPTVIYKGKTLKYKTDYIYASGSATSFADAGKYSVTLEGIGNFSGSVETTVTLTESARNISSAKVSGIASKYTYPLGTADADIVPVVTYKGVNGELVKGTDYTYTITNNSGIGTATVTFTGIGNYYGTKKVTYKIVKSTVKTSIEDATITIDGDVNEDGSLTYLKGGVTPSVTVVDSSSNTLTKGTDYTVSYKNNKKVGTATVIVKGKGSYKGKCSTTFEITESDISALSILATDVVYSSKSGAYKKTKVTITDTDGKKLVAGKDYDKSFTYEADSEVPEIGEYVYVTISAREGSNYTGSISAKYKIYDKSMDISKAKVVFNKKSFEYAGGAVEPSYSDMTVTFKQGKNTTTLYSSSYEIVSYTNNEKVGTAKVTIRGIGQYGGMKTVSFKISSKAVTQ